MIKYVICDIDGVLYNGKINNKLIKTLIKNKLKVVINTGRGYERVKQIFNKKILSQFHDVMLVENGNKIVNKNGDIIKDNPLFCENIGVLTKIKTEDIIFANYVKRDTNEYVFFNKKLKNFKYIEDYHEFIKQAIEDCASRIVFNMNSDNLNKYYLILGQDFQTELGDNKYLMVSNKNVNKNYAIEYFVNSEKLNKTEIAVIGNDVNDISYFKQKEFLKIAVVDENTPNELVGLADYSAKFNNCYNIIKRIFE